MAAGAAAWRDAGADPGRGEGKVLGEGGIPAEKAGRQDTHPAEKTFPGDLRAKPRKGVFFPVYLLHHCKSFNTHVHHTQVSSPAVRRPRWACPSSP